MSVKKRWPAEVVFGHSKKGLVSMEHSGVRELYGREAISQLFQFDIHLVSEKIIDPNELLKGNAGLVFHRREEENAPYVIEREITGIVSGVRDRLVGRSGYQEYVLTFVPALWLASLTTTSDVYLDTSIPSVIELILTKRIGMQMPRDFELRLDGDYPTREVIVQYNESYLNFLSRLCEHVGIYFFFEWNADDRRTKVVFADANDHFVPANPKKAHFEAGHEQRSYVFNFEAAVRNITQTFSVRDYNYRTSAVEIGATDELKIARTGRYDEFGPHAGNPAQAEALMKVRAERAATEYQHFEGKSDYPGFAAGHTTEIDHPAESVTKGSLIVTEVVHHGSWVLGLFGSAGTSTYENSFHTIPKQNQYRPARIARRPVVPGLLTALVESDSEKTLAATDDTGRYRLKFHYDSRHNTEDGKRPVGKGSKAVRMAQPNTGLNRKLHFPLTDGTEVAVGFVNGDPDRPIILGAVPDLGASKQGKRGSIVDDQNKEKLIFRTNESEMSVDDQKGTEHWRWAVGDWSHVQLIGHNEGTKESEKRNAKTHIREDGFAFATIANLTATANHGMTFESSLLTALQQEHTVLTKDRVCEFVGEDPGWEDWKKFDEALLKAEEYKLLAVKLAAAKAQEQFSVAEERAKAAKEAHQKTQKETVKAVNQERQAEGKGPIGAGDLDKERSETDTEQAGKDQEAACAEEEQKQKELEELQDKEAAAAARLREANTQIGVSTKAIGKLSTEEEEQRQAGNSDAERVARQRREEENGKLENAKAQRDAAQQESDGLDAQVKAKKAEVAAAKEKCKKARENKGRQDRKQQALDKEQKSADKVKRADAKVVDSGKQYKRLENTLAGGKKTEVDAAEAAKEQKKPDKKDLWSKVTKEQSDEAHKTHLDSTKTALKDAADSLKASTEREDGDAGEFVKPYTMRVSKDSAGIIAHKNAFVYGDKHAMVYSHKHAHLVSQDQAHVKADKGVEIATDDWIKVTSTNVIDLQCDTDIQLVADTNENKKMPGGHSMLFYSFKGINMESATGMIEGKAMKSIELTASTQGVKVTATLQNIDLKAVAGQITGMGTAGIDWKTPAMFGVKAGGMITMQAGGLVSAQAGGAVSVNAGAACSVAAGAAISLTAGAAVAITAGGLVSIIGSGLLLL